MNEEVKEIGNTLELDLSSQASIAQINKKLKNKIKLLLRDISADDVENNKHRGVLIVLGEFVRFDYKVPGMRQIGSNPLIGTATYITDKDIKEKLDSLLSEDGAMLIDTTGQIMAAQVYLQVDHAEAQVEEECSTRHISAASFSMHEHIVACFTMSEETSKVREYIDGKQEFVFDPHIKEEDDDENEI